MADSNNSNGSSDVESAMSMSSIVKSIDMLRKTMKEQFTVINAKIGVLDGELKIICKECGADPIHKCCSSNTDCIDCGSYETCYECETIMCEKCNPHSDNYSDYYYCRKCLDNMVVKIAKPSKLNNSSGSCHSCCHSCCHNK